MGFLFHLFGQSKPDIAALPQIGNEIPCDDDFSIVIRGYDSTVAADRRENLFIRQYPIFLKETRKGALEEFMDENPKVVERIESDGTVLLDTVSIPNPYGVEEELTPVAERMRGYGIALPMQPIEAAIAEDSKLYKDMLFKPVEKNPKKASVAAR